MDYWSEIAVEEQLEGIICTNWAVPFSLGRPYGLFETSYYTIAYGADRCWNCYNGRNDFLERFYHSFHGVKCEYLTEEGFLPEDYYRIMPRMIDKVTNNEDVAELIMAMLDYEDIEFPAEMQIYRIKMFPEREEEITSLRAKARETYYKLRKSKKNMERILPLFLISAMVELFINSRYCLTEINREAIEKLLNESVLINPNEQF